MSLGCPGYVSRMFSFSYFIVSMFDIQQSNERENDKTTKPPLKMVATIFDQAIDGALIWESFATIAGTATLILGLEVLCWDVEWHEKITTRQDIRNLYFSAIRQNLFAGIVLGPPAYAMVTSFLADQGNYQLWFVSIPGILFVQSVMYGMFHFWMHKPQFYVMIHKYHHQFNEKTFVRPISANAVSCAELLIAYQFPLVVGTLLFRPTKDDMYWALMISSLTNLLIHTPPSALPNFYEWMPHWFCSNHKHFVHHELNAKQHYCAPIFDLDDTLGLDGNKLKNC